MSTVPALNPTGDILDTDLLMITHANGTSEKMTGANFNKRNQIIIASNLTITGAPLHSGNVVRVYFTADIAGANGTSAMVINYNGTNYNVKAPSNGSLKNFTASSVDGAYKYLQAYTTLELLFDGTQFVIIGNPVVISSADYTIYTDGSTEYTKTGTDNLFKPYNQLTNISFKGAKAVVKLNTNSSTTFDFSKLAGNYYNQSKTFVFQFIGWSEQYGAINMVTRTTFSSWSVNLVTNFTLTLSRQDNSVTISNNTLYACIVEIEVIAIF